ncbi:hypothetical protein DFJ74DRAFT_704094 [Hyaloraphidium curvatum]|nr:hypothetical protein DFJ74DRAFT_704094 [Hyaloraphidium curvatum]
MLRNAINGAAPELPPGTPLAGKTAVVTGSNRGIGLEAARHLRALGCSRVVLGVRHAGRGEKAAEELRAGKGEGVVEVRTLDLGSFAGVRAFAEEWAKQDGDARRIDLLVNNAGVQAPGYVKTDDGYELTLQTNHLSSHLLTLLLLPFIAPGGRIVDVGSRMHFYSSIKPGSPADWAKRNGPEGFSATPAYCDSKVANMACVNRLDALLREKGRGIRAVCVHPGLVSTDMASDAAWGERAFNWFLRSLFGRLPEEGGRSVAFAACADLEEPKEGERPKLYFHSDGTRQDESEAARDPEIVKEAWEFSNGAVGWKGEI